ncbi:hypothetical protein Lal_00031909 [Lupinus albus]|nr:hypothetical protein Lal_00031909 [Lupinus albus]
MKLFVTMLLSTSMNKPDQKHGNDYLMEFFTIKEIFLMIKSSILGKSNGLNLLTNSNHWISQELMAMMWRLVPIDEQLKSLTLLGVKNLLEQNRKSWKDYLPMPYPNGQQTNIRVIKNIPYYHPSCKSSTRSQFLYCYQGVEQHTLNSKYMYQV